MEERYEEGLIEGSIDSMRVEKMEKILNQMKRCICKVIGVKIGTGFFCKILYQNKLTPVMITNYHVINNNYINNNKQIKISINENKEIININKKSKIYSSKINEYDIMIIKLNEDKYNYLELDQNIFKNNSDTLFENESIYILHYQNGNKASVSYGYGIKKINDYDIKHVCNTESGSSGGPILSLESNKIIGIHKGFIKKENNNFNIGTFIKFPLNEINKINNEIRMKINIKEKDINKEIYYLDNTNGTYIGVKHYHDNLKELNKYNTELYVNNKKVEYKKYFKPEKEGIYEIILKFNISIKDCSYMFYDCKNIENIDFISFDTTNINNMRGMFYGCSSLKSIPDISNWNTTNVNNMSGMFGLCSSLKSIPDISNWNTTNVKDIEGMFGRCSSLKSIPDISNWNTTNVNNMGCMFFGCSSLKSIPDISNWNTTNIKDMSYMFADCSSLKSIPVLENWNTTNAKDMEGMFDGCSSLKSIPYIRRSGRRRRFEPEVEEEEEEEEGAEQGEEEEEDEDEGGED